MSFRSPSIRTSLSQPRHPWREVWQHTHLRRSWMYCFSCLSKNWYFEVGEACLCGHFCVTSLQLCISSPNPWVLFSGVRIYCWMLCSASRVAGVFGGQALLWSEFIVIVSSTSSCGLCMLYNVNSNSNHCLIVQWASIFYQSSTHSSCGRSSSIGIRSIKV